MEAGMKTPTLTFISDLLAESHREGGYESLRNSGSYWWEEVTARYSGAPADMWCTGCGCEKVDRFNPFTLRWGGGAGLCAWCRAREAADRCTRAAELWKKTMAARLPEHLGRCGVPKRFLSASGKDVAPKVWQAVSGAARCKGGVGNNGEKGAAMGVMIFGRAGSGKTHLAVALLRHFLEQMEPVFVSPQSDLIRPVRLPVFITVTDMLLHIRDSFRRDPASPGTVTEKDLIDRYAQAPLCVLDDLAAEKTSPWSAQTLSTIINRRYMNEAPLIVTGNLGLKAIEDNFNSISPGTGTRLASRIGGMGRIINLEGKDRRIHQ